MKKSPRTSNQTTQDALDARLAAYASQAAADVHITARGSRSGPELTFASAAEALAAPDAAAPGFVSFTGGAHQRSAHFGAPLNVLPTQAGIYAELDEGMPDLRVDGRRRDQEKQTEYVPLDNPRAADDPFVFTLPQWTDDDAEARALSSLPAIGLLALGAPGLRKLRRRRDLESPAV